MKPSVRIRLLAFTLATTPTFAKDRAWQAGKLLDSDRNAYFVGTTGSGSTYDYGYGTYSSADSTAIYRIWQYFTIEGDTTVYLARERLRWKRSKPADVAVNGAVRYAVDKQKLVVLDDQGKEHEMEIIKRVLKAADRR